MKNTITFLSFFVLLATKTLGQVCHIELTDASGFNTQPYQTFLENEACQLRNTFPIEFQSQFKVIETGFYLHIPLTIPGIPPMFENAKTQANTNSDYYLLISKQSDQSGIYTKFWVDVKLPETGIFTCLT